MSKAHTAYLVGLIDRTTLQLVSASIFSEPNPTIPFRYVCVTLAKDKPRKGECYGDAAKRLQRSLGHIHYDWLMAVFNKKVR